MASCDFSECQMSEETFDYICTGCDRENKTLKATKYCVECKEYFCVSCMDMHNKFSYLTSHSLLDVGQGKQSDNQAASSPEFPTERCCIHKGQVRDMYCGKHNEVGCYVCIATEHRTCPESQICSIPDMVDTLFNLSDSQQTQDRLQQMIVTLTSLSESKDNRLEIMKEAKDKCIEQIEKFQNVLQQIINRAAEDSKKEVKDAYQRLEADILQDKSIINSTNDALQKTDDKLKKASGNRAQRFVCSKEAEKNIKEAEDEKMKQETDNNTDVGISFRPNDKLMDYIKGLQGLGNVLVANKKRNLYMLKGSRDINFKVSDDTSSCSSWGCCLTYDNQLLLTDYNNKKIKRVETHTFSVVDYITSESRPQGICCINQHEVAVGCYFPHKIQFVSIDNKMTPTRKIDTSHDCYGIAMKDDNLYVTDYHTSLYVYDMNGTKLRTITNGNDGNKLFSKIRHIVFNESGNKMFVCDLDNGIVCFDGKDNYQSNIKDSDLVVVRGVCTDGRGNIFVGGSSSSNVVQFTEDGTKIGIVAINEDGLKDPCSISFDRGQNRMFVTMDSSDILKMYDLE